MVKLSAALDRLMLNALTGAINNDTRALSSRTAIQFPKHLTDEICEYIITGGRYVDFRARDGLIEVVKRFIPNDHYLIQVVSKAEYRKPLDLLFALRNFEAHESRQAKMRAQKTLKEEIGSAGTWLKRRPENFRRIAEPLRTMAAEIASRAPY